MGECDGDGSWSVPQSRARVRVRVSVNFTGRIQLEFSLGSASNMRLQGILYFRIK